MNNKKSVRIISLILFVFIVGIPSLISATETDSILKVNSFKFTSELEKSLYLEAFNSANVETELFFLYNTKTSEEQRKKYLDRINNTIKKIKNSNIWKKSSKKKTLSIIDKINKEFFEEENQKAMFADIFTSKKHSSLSSTILYAVIFDGLEIPFNIKYSESHIYINPYPQKEQTKDTTLIDKSSSILTVTKETHKIELEILSKTNSSISLDQFGSSKIGDLRTLVGLQYYTIAQLNMEKDLEKAYNNLAKAYYLVEYDNINEQLLNCLANIYNKLSFNDPKKLKTLIRLIEIDKETIQENFVSEAYRSYYQELNNGNITFEEFDLQSKEFIKLLPDAISNMVKVNYHYYQAYYFYNKKDYDLSIEKAKEVLIKEDDHHNAKQILISSLADSRWNDQKILKQLEDIFTSIPKLKSDILLSEAYTTYKLNHVQDLYLRDDFKNGEIALSEFENIYSLDSIAPKLKKDIAEVYDMISKSYYFKKNLKKAREMVNKGLKLDPENYNLQKKKKALK